MTNTYEIELNKDCEAYKLHGNFTQGQVVKQELICPVDSVQGIKFMLATHRRNSVDGYIDLKVYSNNQFLKAERISGDRIFDWNWIKVKINEPLYKGDVIKIEMTSTNTKYPLAFRIIKTTKHDSKLYINNVCIKESGIDIGLIVADHRILPVWLFWGIINFLFMLYLYFLCERRIKFLKLERFAYALILVCICFLIANRISFVLSNLDFFPLNGTFQNYNVVRRVIDGQIPFLDFPVYLGVGHLYLGSLFTFLLGGTYSDSILAFNLLTILFFICFIFYLGNCILYDNGHKWLLIISITFLALYLLLINYSGNSNILCNYLSLVSPEISARLIRGGVVLVTGLILEQLLKKSYSLQYWDDAKIGMFTGVVCLWSNDYGISSVLSVFLVLVLIRIKNRQTSLKHYFYNMIYYSVGVLFGFSIGIILFSYGHPQCVLNTMLGTGSYQSWYYELGAAAKPNYFYQIDRSLIANLLACCVIYYIVRLFSNIRANINERVYIPLYFVLTCYITVNEYHLLSGGYNHELSYLVVCCIVIFELVSWGLLWHQNVDDNCNELVKRIRIFFKKYINKQMVIITVCTLSMILTIYCLSSVKHPLYPQGIYIAEMGGDLYNKANAVISSKEFLKCNKIFSTYASAVECVTKQFQPSGYDYIIHVLGDNARKDYLNSFKEEKFDYVTTLRDDFTPWERWVRNANWFFYRELYSQYYPVYATDYQIYWERKPKKVESEYVFRNIIVNSTEVVKQSQSKSKISIKSEKPIDGIADLHVRISTNQNLKNVIQKLLTIKNYITIRNNSDDLLYQNYNFALFNLPCDNKIHVIPAVFIDGMAELEIDAYPSKTMTIESVELEVGNFYTMPYSFLCINNVEVNNGKVVIKFIDKNTVDKRKLKKYKFICFGTDSIPIEKVVESKNQLEKQWIITIDEKEIKNLSLFLKHIKETKLINLK